MKRKIPDRLKKKNIDFKNDLIYIETSKNLGR